MSSCNKKWWHRPRPTGFLNFGHMQSGSTEYYDTYKAYKIPMTESFKPNEVMRTNDAKLSDQTTFRLDYIPHPLTKHEPRPLEVYKPPDKAMEGISMYRQDYPTYKSGPVQLAKAKDHRKPPTSKFEANPTYSSDFKRWEIPQRVKVGPQFEYKKPEVKMESTSTFQKDFIHRYCPPRESVKPPAVAFKSDDPIESQTLHKMYYVPHQLEARFKKEKETYNPPSIPMDGTTTFQTDFRGKKAPPAESMRPAQSAFQSKDPLSTSSEFRDQFIAWPVHRPERHEALKYVPPQGTMDLQSTQRLDFRSVNGKPALPVKPAVKLAKSHPFEGTTNYSNDFKRWKVERILQRPKNEYVQGTAKFDGLSTTRQHYVSYPGVQPAQSFKPVRSAFQSDKGIDDRTIYKTNFVPQSMASVERYPTPDWLKQQEALWKQSGMMSRCDGKAQTVNVAA